MRRKSYDVLFETKMGMDWLAQNPTLWRSLFYFVISVGAYVGVCTNVIFSQQEMAVRFAILIAILLVYIIGLVVFGCFLHGLIDACGGGSGNVKGLLCILGYTGLPFLVLTPVALLAVKGGGFAPLLLPISTLVGLIWSLYLVIRAVEAVYIIEFGRSAAVVLFGILLLLLLIFLPVYILVRVVALSLF